MTDQRARTLKREAPSKQLPLRRRAGGRSLVWEDLWVSTEGELENWRLGSTMAERLCAAILSVDGFYNIEPQAPLGGSDDRKDILATRDNIAHVAAAYFPATRQKYSDIKAKFLHDRAGLSQRGGERFVFLTNQHLSLGNRAALKSAGHETDEIYDLQRIVTILDSPSGYGLRLSYLKIQMTTEEQASFFAVLQEQAARRDERSSAEPLLQKIAGRTLDLLDAVQGIVESAIGKDVLGNVSGPIGAIDIASLLLIHTAVMGPSMATPEIHGRLRSSPVWIADGEGRKLLEVTAPEYIVAELRETLTWWRGAYADLSANPIQDAVVEVLADLHKRLAQTHPFMDGNGRLIRFILDRATEELLGRRIDPALTEDPAAYYAALSAASAGDMGKLRTLLSAALI